jgi:hypothetical protein
MVGDGQLEQSNTCNVASVLGNSSSFERHLVFVLITILLISAASIAALVVEVHRDGYRQVDPSALVRAF